MILADGKPQPLLTMLDQNYAYGGEFSGAQQVVGFTPLTDKCFLSLSQAISNIKGGMLTGQAAVGKTETIKVLEK